MPVKTTIVLCLLHTISVPDLLLGNLLICQCCCDIPQPLSAAVLTTQALSGHTSLPQALFPLIPLSCIILYSEISFHTSVALCSSTSCAPQRQPTTLGSVLCFPSPQCACCAYVCICKTLRPC